MGGEVRVALDLRDGDTEERDGVGVHEVIDWDGECPAADAAADAPQDVTNFPASFFRLDK